MPHRSFDEYETRTGGAPSLFGVAKKGSVVGYLSDRKHQEPSGQGIERPTRGLAVNNLWITLLAAFSLLTVHFLAVVPEEKYLTDKFGDSYRGYLIKVRRYL